MIKLHSMPGSERLESISPFCMKVEVYLKLQGLPYEVVNGDPRKAPKGKMPVVEIDATTIADSSAILNHLEKTSKKPLDHDLSEADRARAHALKRLFEESLYWPLLWSRWGDDEGWAELGKMIEGLVPAVVRWFIPGVIRKKVIAQSVAQGVGRHTREEIYALGAADLDAVAGLLGDQKYFLGDELRTIDIIAYSFLGNVMLWKVASPLTKHARSHANLVAFVDRIGTQLKASRSESAAPS